MKNKNKNRVGQIGLVKEVLVIIIVIFILSYFNLDPTKIWDSIAGVWNGIFG